MAPRQPLFMDQLEGYPSEMATTDSMTLGGLTMGGNINMQTVNSITNLPDTPSANTSAVNKNYVDSVAQGLVIKGPCHQVATLIDGNITLSGIAQNIDGHEVNEGDRILLTAQTSAIENGIWVAHGARAFLDLSVPGTLLDTVIEAVTGGTGGNSITFASVNDGAGADSITRVTNAFTLHYTSGATTVAQVEALITALAGADKLIRVKTAGTGANVLLNPGDTFSATNLAAGSASAWTRPVDFAAGSHSAHAFTFIETGTDYSDSGWVCTTNGPTDVVGTNSLAFVQFSSAGVTTASTGLVKVGNDIRVKKGDGIEVTSNGASTNIALSASNPCLALVGTAGSRTLEAQVVPPASGAGGIEKTSTGLQLDLDGTTLRLTSSGVSVLGLPSNFEINGMATHYAVPTTGQVTAGNLDTLTAGSASNADALHSHSSGVATEAPKVENTLTVIEAIAIGDPVYFTNTNNRIGKGDTTDPKAFICGVARTAQPTPSSTCEVVSLGPCAGVLNGLVPTPVAGDRFYLQTGGGIGVALPGSGKRQIRVGYAINASDLFVEIMDFGKKA
jgi:hypothetical protein